MSSPRVSSRGVISADIFVRRVLAADVDFTCAASTGLLAAAFASMIDVSSGTMRYQQTTHIHDCSNATIASYSKDLHFPLGVVVGLLVVEGNGCDDVIYGIDGVTCIDSRFLQFVPN